MKRTLLLSMMLAGVATCLAEPPTSEVSSANTIGLLKVSDTTKDCLLVAVPWLDYGAGGEIKVVDLIKTANLVDGDKLYVSNGSGYDVYELSDNEWTATKTATVAADGTVAETTATVASDKTLKRGDAIWLKRATSKNAFYLFGQAAAGKASVQVAAGLNLVASPSADGLALASGITGSEIGDEIIVNGNDGEEAHYYFRAPTAGGEACWCKKQAKAGSVRKEYVVATDVIPAGTGFWYRAAKGGTITL